MNFKRPANTKVLIYKLVSIVLCKIVEQSLSACFDMLMHCISIYCVCSLTKECVVCSVIFILLCFCLGNAIKEKIRFILYIFN